MMVRPAHFGYNPQTAESNAFQSKDTDLSQSEIEALARQEFDQFVNVLRQANIHVIVIQDNEEVVKYDAVFTNNWFSSHIDGTVVTYPMFAIMRRLERREEIFNMLGTQFQYKNRLRLEVHEDYDMFLESTGSVILDRPNRLAYACRSIRTSEEVLDAFCQKMGYEKVIFDATDEEGLEIYHTNVMMALGEDFVIICLEVVRDHQEWAMLHRRFNETGKTVIEISYEQMTAFAGNMLQVRNRDGETFLVMSEQAYRSLTTQQIEQIEQFTNILYSPLYIIEQFGGGSARCMMAEIFLPKKVV
jgi:hypothetical protein